MATAVTLAQSRALTGDTVDARVIDEFVKSSFVMANIPFVPVAAATGGAGWAYTYNRLVNGADGAVRAIGSDYTASVAEVERKTVLLSILGGKFDIDRALASQGNGAEVALQIAQKVKGASAKFADMVVNGDSENAGEFDGLSAALADSDTEVDGSAQDWAAVATQAEANAALDALDSLLSQVNSSEGVAIFTNRVGALRLQSICRIAGYKTSSEDAAGRPVNTYAGVPIVDLGAKPGSNDPVVAVTEGATDIYVASMSVDGFHAVSPAGQPIVKTYLPDFTANNGSSVASGAVEMVAAAVLKSTRGAAVLRGVTVQ